MLCVEQNSAYGSTNPGLDYVPTISLRQFRTHRMSADTLSASQPYPDSWEDVAELRVFKTTPEQWQRLIGWRNEMKSKGWRLLQVKEIEGDLTAVFGRTREELLSRQSPTG